MKKLLFLLLTATFCYGTTSDNLQYQSVAGYPLLTYDQWQNVAPYLLPDAHPLKAPLDKIFKKERVTANLEAFEKAGFSTKGIRGFSHTVVARHKKLPGVLVKLFLDDQNINDLYRLMRRLKGAALAKQIIENHGWQPLMKVPRKWLYIIPESPQSSGPYPKHFVLIAEDMHLLDKPVSYDKWKSNTVDKAFLDMIFVFLTEGGFNDSVFAFNLPFSKDGRIAVIDTEHYDARPVNYQRFTKYLSPKMADYWNELISIGGPH